VEAKNGKEVCGEEEAETYEPYHRQVWCATACEELVQTSGMRAGSCQQVDVNEASHRRRNHSVSV